MTLNQNNDEVEVNLLDILYLIRKKLPLIIGFALIIAACAFFVNKFVITPSYSSTTKLYVINSDSITTISDLQIGSSLTQDYIQLIQSRPVVQTVIDNLDLDTEYEDLLKCVSISNPTDTRMLHITVTYDDPYSAKEIADEFATVSIDKISEIMQAEEPTVVEQGVVNTKPVSPNITRNVIITTIFGTILAIVLIIISFILDDTIKGNDDVEKYLGITTLSEIPLDEPFLGVFKNDKLKFLNKYIITIRKDFKNICRKLPLGMFHSSKETLKKHTKH